LSLIFPSFPAGTHALGRDAAPAAVFSEAACVTETSPLQLFHVTIAFTEHKCSWSFFCPQMPSPPPHPPAPWAQPALGPMGLGGSESPPSGLKGESARGQQPPAQSLPLPLSRTHLPASPQPSRSRSATCRLLPDSPCPCFPQSWKERRRPHRSA
ncbi:hypothetical protein MC885_017567, partial [Smutsia gigantea]